MLIGTGSKLYLDKLTNLHFRAEIKVKTHIYEIGYDSSASKTQCAHFNAIFIEKHIPT